VSIDHLIEFYRRSLSTWMSAENVELSSPAYLVIRLPELALTGNPWCDRMARILDAYNRHTAVDAELMREAGQAVIWATYDGKTWALEGERVPVEGHESS